MSFQSEDTLGTPSLVKTCPSTMSIRTSPLGQGHRRRDLLNRLQRTGQSCSIAAKKGEVQLAEKITHESVSRIVRHVSLATSRYLIAESQMGR